MLDSFRAEVSYANAPPLLVDISMNRERWTGRCSSLEYVAVVGGWTGISPSHDTFDAAKLPRVLGFSPETAGIILGGQPPDVELDTELGYDEQHRQFVRRQVFGFDGVTYEAVYSGYNYKGPPAGKLSSYTVRVRVVPR